jgi:hypothetical protein
MLTQRKPSHGVMEGEGAYNQHAKLSADGAALALPLLEKAVREVVLRFRADIRPGERGAGANG